MRSKFLEQRFTGSGPVIDGFKIRAFSPELLPALADFANALHLPHLVHRPFLDHYYQGQEWSKLFLILSTDGSTCLGLMGVDMLRFATPASSLTAAFGTNFYSVQPGVGGMLWLKWIKMGDLGLLFGGSKDAHRILRAGNFEHYSGVNLYKMNAEFEPYKEDSSIKGIVKAGLRPWRRKKLPEYASKSFLRRFADVQVCERQSFSAEMMVQTSPFTLRFQPSLEYLQWRYAPTLSYVRYRIFQIFRSGQSCGYCVLNLGPGEITVVHSDGNDPASLAAGILKAIFAAGEDGNKHRKVLLASSHPEMQSIFTESGFRLADEDYPFAAGSLRASIDLGNPKTWLINFGIGDNDLRSHMFWPAH